MDPTSSIPQNPSESASDREPKTIPGSFRPSRPSSPDFPPHASPEMPLWLAKCVKITNSGPQELVKAELLKLLEECLQRREQRDRHEAAAATLNLPVPKKESKVQPAKTAPNAMTPSVKVNSASKKRPASPTGNEAKQSSSSVPPVVSLQSPGSPEYPPPSSMTLSAGAPDGMDVVVSSRSGESSNSMDVDEEIDLAMLLEDPCFVCGQARGEPGNRLLDCESCRKRYHQKCHVPKVTDIDPSDTRLIWNCAQCAADHSRKAVNFQPTDAAISSPVTGTISNPIAPPTTKSKSVATKTVLNKDKPPNTSAGAASVEPFKRDTAKVAMNASQGRGLGGYASSIKKDTKITPGSKKPL